MEELKKLFNELYPGFSISCIEEFYRPGRNWQTKVDHKQIASMSASVAYKKAVELRCTRICVRLHNKKTGEIQRPDVMICTKIP